MDRALSTNSKCWSRLSALRHFSTNAKKMVARLVMLGNIISLIKRLGFQGATAN